MFASGLQPQPDVDIGAFGQFLTFVASASSGCNHKRSFDIIQRKLEVTENDSTPRRNGALHPPSADFPPGDPGPRTAVRFTLPCGCMPSRIVPNFRCQRYYESDGATIGIPLNGKVCSLVLSLLMGLSTLAGCTVWRQPNGAMEPVTSTTGAPSYAPSGTSLAPTVNLNIRNVGTARPAGNSATAPNLVKLAEKTAPVAPMFYKAPAVIPAPPFAPWPLPRPSISYVYPDSHLKPFQNRSVWVLSDHIQTVVQAAGYPAGSVLSAPGGFVLALPFERIDDKGYPRTVNRFVTDLRWFAPENILETWYRIFNRRIDHYRQIIFVLTSDASRSQKFPESFSSLKALTDNGQLFSDVATTQVITSSLHLYVLIYEFDLEKKEGPKFLFASQVPVLDHLLNSKIRLQ